MAVRALCEFTAKCGDLDLRFTPAPSAREGIAGHTLVTSRRGGSYQSEVTLNGQFGHLAVKGRADGYDPDLNQLEEIKTYRGDLARIPENHRQLHWAQAKVYGWLLCQKLGLSELKLALVYFDVGTLEETVLSEQHSAQSLQAFFEGLCTQFLEWSSLEMAHRKARNASLQALSFPHMDFRPGQRALAEAVYNSARSGRCVMAQAPTGIGKTQGTVFPLLKAMPAQRLDKVFFLAAKASGRSLALEAFTRLASHAAGSGHHSEHPVRVLEMVARDKACEHPDKACHGDSCPLAKGFYDRLPQARRNLLEHTLVDKAATRQVALAHGVCPYYLSQDAARWADVVVGDYNYYFDQSALLYALAQANDWRVGVLVDEAHNLVERARQMYSAELDPASLASARAQAPAALKSTLGRLQRSWEELHRDQEVPYQTHQEVPRKFTMALLQANAEMTEHMAQHPTGVPPALQAFYFEALQFSRMAEVFGQHSLFDITLAPELAGAGATLCLRNVLPAPFLAPRFAAAHCTALFSATLSPQDFYKDMLGLPDETVFIDVPAPFRAEQLSVQVVRNVSTRFRHREQSLRPLADLIAAQYARQPGNYLAFFSSYDYLEQARQLLADTHPHIPQWEQTRRMDEASRDGFLLRFRQESGGIGFAVLGGSFGEGIDLPGKQLIGAFVATLGLPQVNEVNEEIRKRMDLLFGDGHSYAYIFPGLRKVVQAAGRVIRTPEDRGVVYLIDDRFARPEVLALLPSWWKVEFTTLARRQPALTKPAASAEPDRDAPFTTAS
ncbi:MAG: ATP-dependent DNA helicase [Pseudomonadota bacterium]